MATNEGLLTKREFLKRLGAIAAVGAATVVGIKLHSDQSQQEQSENQELSTTSQLREYPPTTEELVFNKEGIKIWSKDGLPSRWEDQNGQGYFDKEALVSAQSKANKNREPIVAQVVRVESNNQGVFVTESTPNIDGIKTLPEDVVSIEELAERGITIINSESMGFHIRHSAFEEGGVMAQYQRGGERKLQILITDSPSLFQEAFIGARYADVQQVIKSMLPSAAAAEGNVQVQWRDGDFIQMQRHEQVAKLLTKEEIMQWGLVGISGYAVRKGLDGGTSDTDYLFLAVSERNCRPDTINCIQLLASPQNSEKLNYTASLEEIRIEEMLHLN